MKEIITRERVTAMGKAEVEENGVYMRGMGEQQSGEQFIVTRGKERKESERGLAYSP